MAPWLDTPRRTRLVTAQRFDFDNGVRLHLRLPADWTCLQPAPRQCLTSEDELQFGLHDLAQPRLIVSLLFEHGGETVKPEQLELIAKASIEVLRPQSADRVVIPHPFACANGAGYGYRVRDRQPAPGEYLYMTQGVVGIGFAILRFTLLTNEGEDDEIGNAGLSVVRAAFVDLQPPAPDVPAEQPFASFLRMRHADDACFHLQDFPETASPTPGNFAEQDPSVMVLAWCTAQRALRGGQALAIGPASFGAGDPLLMGLCQLLVLPPTQDNIEQRREGVVLLGDPSTWDARETRWRSYIGLCAADGLVHDGLALPPRITELARSLLRHSLNTFTQPGELILGGHAAALLSHLLASDQAGHAETVESAIALGRQALACYQLSGLQVDWAYAQLRLGMRFAERVAGRREQNQAEALTRFALALTSGESEPSIKRTANTNIGLIELDRAGEFDVDALKRARSHLEAALRIARDGGTADTIAKSELNLGNAMLRLANGDRACLDHAIKLYEAAIKVMSRERDPFNWSGLQHNLGVAYGMRGKEAPTALDKAVRCFRAALEVRTREAWPMQHLQSSEALAGVLMHLSDPATASQHYADAIAADRWLVGQARLFTARRHQYARTPQLHADAAYCLLRLGRPAEALATLESGRARELRRLRSSTSRGSALPDDWREVLRDSMLGESTAMSTDDPGSSALRRSASHLTNLLGALVADSSPKTADPAEEAEAIDVGGLMASVGKHDIIAVTIVAASGAATLLLPAGRAGLTTEDIVWHSGLTEASATALMVGGDAVGAPPGWLKTYFGSIDDEGWPREIAALGRRLWNAVVEEIWAAIERRFPDTLRRLVIVAPPLLALLPWHASWREVNGQPRYLCDECPVAYAPSVQTYADLREREESSTTRSGEDHQSSLIVADTELDLEFAAIEGVQVATLCATPEANRLFGTQSSFVAVAAAAADKDILHFACHGTYQLDDPLWSSLSLGRFGVELQGSTGDLRLREVLSTWRQIDARLVTLSACETAISDVRQVPNEFLSLASGWMAAGARSVVCSQWKVDDFATLLLMRRFYAHYLGTSGSTSRGDGAAALCNAQRWLKSATNRAIAEELVSLRAMSGLSELQIVLLGVELERCHAALETEQPFAAPFYWGGFVYAGS